MEQSFEQPRVDITEESKRFRKEQILRDGDLMEREIRQGSESFLSEDDRLMYKVQMERAGVNLSVIDRGDRNISQQGEQLRQALGDEKFVAVISEIVTEVIKNPAGEVFKGVDVDILEKEIRVQEFLQEYLEGLLNSESGVRFLTPSFENSWKKNVVYRVEAVVSVANKLLWIMNTEDAIEGGRRQATAGILKHLRERVFRGAERAGEEIDSRVERDDTKNLRRLPPKSVGTVLEVMTRV